jgi:hypothetical protein
LCDVIATDVENVWLAAAQRFSPRTPVSSTNKTDRHDITEHVKTPDELVSLIS